MAPPGPAGRWELLRALGAVADSPSGAAAALTALGLPAVSPAEHTEVFVLNCPPYAAIYLGAEGSLGGEAADRAAGFWRAMGLTPPAEPDHLAALLALYAWLGEAAGEAARPATAQTLARFQAALFWEHLWSWLPGYLAAAAGLPARGLARWARLTWQVIAAEQRALPAPGRLPLALRAAPPQPGRLASLAEVTGALLTPARSGLIITRRQLAAGAAEAGVGYRAGERRFTLRAMLEQDAAATLRWAAGQARWWQRSHARRCGADPACRWWAGRAGGTVRMLRFAVAEVAGRPAG
jgi:TorA maturation chaperone TorD